MFKIIATSKDDCTGEEAIDEFTIAALDPNMFLVGFCTQAALKGEDCTGYRVTTFKFAGHQPPSEFTDQVPHPRLYQFTIICPGVPHAIRGTFTTESVE